jgi:hypothetical protein
VSGTPVTSAASASAVQAAAIDVLANTIYDLQRQIHHIASGVGGYGGYSRYAGVGPSSSHYPNDMPGYSAMMFAPSTAAIIAHTTTASQAVPITQIQFPLSPSPISGFSEPPVYHPSSFPLL